MPKSTNNNPRQHTLDNGLRILLQPNPATPSVAVMVMVGVGSRYETLENNGIAHFLEHMSFKGTERRPTTLDIAETIDGVGGESNAFTGKEYTGYFIKVASQELPLAIDVLEDIIFHSIYNPQEADREKQVIIEEINMYHDSPRDYVGEMYDQLVYPHQPLGMEIAGSVQSLSRIGSTDLKNFVEQWYVPNNMIVAVSGNFDSHQTQTLIEQAFGQLSAKKVEGFHPANIAQDHPLLSIQTKDTDQTQLLLGLRSYPANHPLRYALGILTTILGGNMSSRLFTQVRERRGLAYAVHASIDDYIDAGTLVISAGLGHHNVKQALEVIMDQLRDIRNNSVTDQELDKAKHYLQGRLALATEDSLGMAMYYARQWLLEGQIRTIDQIVENINQVTMSDLEQVAKDIIKNEGLNLAAIGPEVSPQQLEPLLKL